MSREIKFRGKCIETNEWVYGNLVVDTMTGKKMSIIEWADMGEENKNGGAYVWIDIIPGTESQLIGLKDKKGIEVYECDIVAYWGGKGQVVFHNSSFGIWYSEYDIHDLSPDVEVIGNIYENPELLNQK